MECTSVPGSDGNREAWIAVVGGVAEVAVGSDGETV